MNYLQALSDMARTAGAAILEVYNSGGSAVQTKRDNSPLTEADLASHHIIVAALGKLAPELPVLSEEAAEVPFAVRRGWDRYFLIDPLDGTREFINRNGEFTVNIALIERGVPMQGVVYVPMKDVLYAGSREPGQEAGTAWVERDGQRSPIAVRQVADPLRVVASRSHAGDSLEQCLDLLKAQFPKMETVSLGSSLKLCLIAEGKADLYPRLSPTSEWDTAAAQAVVEAAGGKVVDLHFDGLKYNTGESLLNPFFYVIGDRQFNWQGILEKLP